MPRSPEIIENEISKLRLDIVRLEDELKGASDGLVKCIQCKKWFKLEDLTEGSYKETKTETVFQDCGYGDDDELADVTRMHVVKRCPKCGYELDRKSYYIGETNRRRRVQ